MCVVNTSLINNCRMFSFFFSYRYKCLSVCLYSRMNIYLFGLLCFRRLLLLLIGNGGGIACSIVEFVVSIWDFLLDRRFFLVNRCIWSLDFFFLFWLNLKEWKFKDIFFSLSLPSNRKEKSQFSYRSRLVLLMTVVGKTRI